MKKDKTTVPGKLPALGHKRKTEPLSRQERLGLALRENLLKRKSQLRARQAALCDDSSNPHVKENNDGNPPR